MPKDLRIAACAVGSSGGRVDDDLAHAAARGDEAALVALIERHYDRLYRLAWRWCGSRTEAEDVTQDVCVKLGQSIRGWRGEAAFGTWATRIAYTTAMDRLRARRRLRVVAPAAMSALVEHTSDAAEPSAEVHVLYGELWDEVRRLPDQQRDAVLLVYGEDMSHAEAASMMGCTEKTVSWHLHEARKRLKTRLGEVG